MWTFTAHSAFFTTFLRPPKEEYMWGSDVCTHTCTALCGFRWCVCVSAGLEMAWVQRPPEKVTNGEEFNVSYTVTASDSFYDYAVRNGIFQFRWASLVSSTWNLSAKQTYLYVTTHTHTQRAWANTPKFLYFAHFNLLSWGTCQG